MVRRGDTMEDLRGRARVRIPKAARGTNGELLRLECFLGLVAFPREGVYRTSIPSRWSG